MVLLPHDFSSPVEPPKLTATETAHAAQTENRYGRFRDNGFLPVTKTFALTVSSQWRENQTVEKRYGIILAVAAIVVGVGFGMVGLFEARKSDSQSIVNVLNRNTQAVRVCTQIHTTGHMPRRQLNTLQYVSELRKIDTSRCPKKFQRAWLDYVQAWERESKQTSTVMLTELTFGIIGVAATSSSVEDMGANPVEANDTTERACHNVERVALEYDVRVKYPTDRQE